MTLLPYSDLAQCFWRFDCPTRVLACANRERGVQVLPALVSEYGRQPAIITDEGVRQTGFFQTMVKPLQREIFLVGGDGHADAIREVIKALPAGTDCLVAVGGGSVLDAAKCIAAAVPGQLDPAELPHRTDLAEPPLDLVCLPTTFGTGSEANHTSHLRDGAQKISFKKPWLSPQAALLVGDAAKELSEDSRFLTGLDAWIHVLEVRTLKRERSPLQDALMDHALALADEHFAAFTASGCETSGQAMAAVSFIGGMGIHNARTGLMHTLAVPFAECTGLPHNQSLLPFLEPVLRFHWPGFSQVLGMDWPQFLKGTGGFMLTRAEALMKRSSRPEIKKHIPQMVDACLRDRVILKENPAPLSRDSFVSLYDQALV